MTDFSSWAHGDPENKKRVILAAVKKANADQRSMIWKAKWYNRIDRLHCLLFCHKWEKFVGRSLSWRLCRRCWGKEELNRISKGMIFEKHERLKQHITGEGECPGCEQMSGYQRTLWCHSCDEEMVYNKTLSVFVCWTCKDQRK